MHEGREQMTCVKKENVNKDKKEKKEKKQQWKKQQWKEMRKYDAIEIVNGVNSIHAEDTVMPTTAQQHKGKSISVLKKPRAVHVRKPLTVTLNDFPIVPKSVAKASSSRSTQLKNNTTTLDKMRHSSIVISENSDPNLRVPTMAPNATPACNNSLTLGKPPDPCVILPADLGEDDMRNKQVTYVINVDSQLEAQTNAIKQQKRITALKLPSSECCSDATTLHYEAANFFQALFTADNKPNGRLPVSDWFPPLPQEATDSFGDVPSDQEIHAALMSMAPLKSLGSTIAHILSIKCPNSDDGDDQSIRLKRLYTCCAIATMLFTFGCKSFLHPQWKMPWSLVFASLVWQIWKQRNDLIFHNLILTVATIIDRSLAWVKYYFDNVMLDKMSPSTLRSKTLEWTTLGLEWVCLNVVGVVSLPLSDGSIGGLFQNKDGD
ncbi:hypothetical protein V6N11_004920 [Hibiscus sabdariffa]|uniref:Uncharacterized protein n=1 Tax=Hibiscus sabdariffa TaxID=183260 RepID=A0ABR2SHP4_9ROSI